MQLRPIDEFFLNKQEPVKSCLQALRQLMLNYHPSITEEWKYKLPFYYFKGKMFCYLWVDKKTGHPYIGIVQGGRIAHSLLEQGDRKRMKVLTVNANCDIPVDIITEILDKARVYYK